MALVTCRPQFSPPSARQADRSPSGRPGGRRETGSIPPQRAERVREVAPFSTICHYLKWHVIVLCSQIHYASTESRGLVVEGGGQNWSGRGFVKGGVAPRLFISGLRHAAVLYFFGVCFFSESGRWCFTVAADTGSLLGSQRKLTVSPGQRLRCLS